MKEGPKNQMVCPVCGENVPVRCRVSLTTGFELREVAALGFCPRCGNKLERTQKYDWRKHGRFKSEKTRVIGRKKTWPPVNEKAMEAQGA